MSDEYRQVLPPWAPPQRVIADLVTIHDTAGREVHREPVVDGRPVCWCPDREVTVVAYVWWGCLRIPSMPMFKTLGRGGALTVPVELTISDV